MKLCQLLLILQTIILGCSQMLLAGAARDFSDFQGGMSFTEAHVDDGSLYIHPFKALAIDWKIKMPADIKQRAANLKGRVELNFEAPVDKELRQLFFYYADSNGIQQIRPIKLHGVVRKDSTYGKIEATSETGRAKDGLVLISREPIDFEVIPLSSDSPGVTFPNVGRKGAESHLPGIQKVYELRNKRSGDIFIFVQWEPDTKCQLGCCAVNLDLYRKGSSLDHLVWLRSACDI